MNKRERRARKSQTRALKVARAVVPPREGPRPTLQEFLNEWIEKGRETFAKDQTISPVYIGWLPNNSQLILTMLRLGDKQEQQAFNVGSENILQEAGAVMILWISEAWASENLNMKASKSDDRKEVVIFNAYDGENEHVAILEVNRDWQDGKAMLGEPEYARDTEQAPAH